MKKEITFAFWDQFIVEIVWYSYVRAFIGEEKNLIEKIVDQLFLLYRKVSIVTCFLSIVYRFKAILLQYGCVTDIIIRSRAQQTAIYSDSRQSNCYNNVI